MRELWGQLPFLVQVLLALALVLALVAVIFFLIRRFTDAAATKANGRTRQPRLGVIDVANIDGRRRLVIIRRDAVEHLLMIGGPNDVVIEANIIRAQNPAQVREGRSAQLGSVEEVDGMPVPALSPAPRDLPAAPQAKPGPRIDTRLPEPKRAAVTMAEPARAAPVTARPPAPRPLPVDNLSGTRAAPRDPTPAMAAPASGAMMTSPRMDPPIASPPIAPPSMAPPSMAPPPTAPPLTAPAMSAAAAPPARVAMAPPAIRSAPATPEASPKPSAPAGEAADLEAEMASILGHLSAPPRT